MKSYFLSIDLGTESARAAIIDGTGSFLGMGVAPNTNISPKPGWVEQSVFQWENSIGAAVREAISKSGISKEAITAIGVDATSPTLVVLGKNGRPLRNAVMWMDIRAVQEAEAISSLEDAALKYVGFGKVSPEWLPCKVAWLKRHETEVYEEAATLFDHTDWLFYYLTGERTVDLCSATARNFYNATDEVFPRSLYDKAGIGDACEKFPNRTVSLGSIEGRLSKSVSEKLGLKSGIPVAAGGPDGYIGVIGVNALSAGRMALITGSSQLILGLTETAAHFNGINGTFPDILIPGLHVVEAGQTSTGSVLRWFKDNFVNEKIEEEARDRGISVYSLLDEKAALLPPGSDGLVVLEHWQGNRTPWVDPHSRGVIRGLTLHHRPEHLYRSIMEAVVYGAEVILQKFREHSIHVETLVACGGASTSSLWMQLFADITGKPIIIPKTSQSVMLGNAVIAAAAIGDYPSIQEAANSMVHIERTVDPDSKTLQRYMPYVKHYIHTYESLCKDSRRLVETASHASNKG
jgi:FGGY-family pentulose kinase